MTHTSPPHTTAKSAKTHYKPQLERLIALGLLGLGALCAQAAPSITVDTEPAPKPEAVAAVEAVTVDPALYTTQTFEWNDIARERAVPARLYLPVGPLKAGAVPMVVFSHGIGGSKEGYSYLGRPRLRQLACAACGQ